MDRERTKDVARLAAYIARESNTSPNPAAAIAYRLHSIGIRLQRYHELACNYGLNPKQEARVTRLRAEAKSAVESLGWTVNHFNSDPCGYAIYVNLPSGASNSWGGQEHGYGI